MESLTRLVSESLARHGFDRPLDYRRLRWSRWFRCESHHSLLLVPSKPGVFAVAEEIVRVSSDLSLSTNREGHDFSRAEEQEKNAAASAAEETSLPRRMLAVSEFFEADDMAFVLDRMLARPTPMRDLLTSGRYFVRFVIIEDAAQRRSICAALNQWVADSTEKISGIGSHFAGSLELTPATEYVPQSGRPLANDAQASLFDNAMPRTFVASAVHANQAEAAAKPRAPFVTAPQIDSGAAANIHCPSPFPSGF
jgi:hypothetical protein